MRIARGTQLRDTHGYLYRVREVLVDTAICVRTSPGGHDSIVMLKMRELYKMTILPRET